ncbi:MAG: (2Fe-2S)-binding protein [Spirochaetales bacterium]|uniref:(2Fe-2S)-binding protein n=1 Tax=Candidatus Thalassospirochaeta sargassi TaxID=3119039 RepID=A0AAJ1MJ68_9SPIO|nr:(2Fe-2S)-binding protein [Spirochaetales bacterium]
MNKLIKISFLLDGRMFSVETKSDRRLLDILREDAGITGVREGCGEGECGACSIFFNGRLANSCCIPAIAAEGAEIDTIDGFSKTEEYSIISQAFADAGAVQCGFCTPGFIMASAALLRENPRPTDNEIKIGLSGNLCRCTGYTMIIEAVRLASGRMARNV